MGEVKLVGVDKRADQAARVVVYLHFQDPFDIDGELASGGVGVDGDTVKVGHVGNANIGNGQLQYHNAVAACLGLAFIDIFATLGVSLTVPFVLVNSCVNHGVVAAVVDGEVQGDGAVATLGVES